ncbi:MAG: hypothetical protein R3B70_30335 [Polyangiaceae bacterium]
MAGTALLDEAGEDVLAEEVLDRLGGRAAGAPAPPLPPVSPLLPPLPLVVLLSVAELPVFSTHATAKSASATEAAQTSEEGRREGRMGDEPEPAMQGPRPPPAGRRVLRFHWIFEGGCMVHGDPVDHG